MADKKHILTYEGLKKYEEELQDLKVNQRKEIAGKIKEAREQGDLSENAEYDAAKDEQRDIGCNVTLLDMEYDDEMTYKIVGSTEANSLEGKISNESPVGRALLKKRVGDIVEVETQAGPIKYKVLDIHRV